MGHVDDAALGADRGDRLRHRHAARDLLLEEEADHLALFGGHHLLGDDHLDVAHLRRDAARLQRPGYLVVVGDRDRPEAAVAGGLEQDLDRRRAIGRVIGVHVQVDLDQRATGDAPPCPGVAARVVAAGDEPPVDHLEAIGDRRPVALAAGRLDQLVGGGEVALQQPAGRRRGDRAGVEPAEEDLDQGAGHLGGEHPLLGSVEGGDIERVGVAQRGRGDARREGLVDVDDVQLPRAQQLFDPLAVAGHQHLVTAPPQLCRDPFDILVDWIGDAPAMRRDLGDRKSVSGHGPQHKSPPAGGLCSSYALISSAAGFSAGAAAPLPRALAAMNSSVCSRASSSGRWLCGDFIR